MLNQCGPQQESTMAEVLGHSRADIQLACIKLSILEVISRMDDSMDNPLWKIIIHNNLGEPTLEMEPPKPVTSEKMVIEVQLKRSNPTSKVERSHAEFLSSFLEAREAFAKSHQQTKVAEPTQIVETKNISQKLTDRRQNQRSSVGKGQGAVSQKMKGM